MNFEDKYGIVEDASVKEFHKQRRMFAINNGIVYVATQTEDSHATWFTKLGWITEDDDSIMNKIVRGYVDSTGIYFYRGYDFVAEPEDIRTFIQHLTSLKRLLNIDESYSVIYAGLIPQSTPGRFPPRKILNIHDIIEEE